VQRLARLTHVDEQTVLAVLAKRGQRRGPAPIPSRGEARREARQAPDVPDGETQLLLLLLHRPECRAVAVAVDADTFEDSTNRRLFLAWQEFEELDEHADEFDDDVRERLAALLQEPPQWLDPQYLDQRYVEEMAEQIASELRLRRAQARLVPAAAEQADQVAAARRDGATILESAARAAVEGPVPAEAATETAALAADFVEMSERQRELTHEYQLRKGRRSFGEKDGDREEGTDDADL
jgi:hypothetical protein